MSEDYSLTDSALNAIAESYGKATVDLDLVIVIAQVRDLGWHIRMVSGEDQVCDSGAPVEDLGLGLSRLFARAVVKVEEYREMQAQEADLD